jgi:2-methylcitrate dehydratase
VKSAASATVIVGGQQTSPDLAAFANGVMIRYLDYNDTYTGVGTCHPSDLLAPALAAAECTGGGGREVLLGFVLGYEVLCALADTAMHRRGWDQAGPRPEPGGIFASFHRSDTQRADFSLEGMCGSQRVP